MASTLAALHVGPAREITPIVPDPPVNVQESLLMDEDIVEGILFGVTGRATRPAILEVQSINDTIVATLSAARCVCKLWRTAGERPLTAAALDRNFARFKVVMDFFPRYKDDQRAIFSAGVYGLGKLSADMST